MKSDARAKGSRRGPCWKCVARICIVQTDVNVAPAAVQSSPSVALSSDGNHPRPFPRRSYRRQRDRLGGYEERSNGQLKLSPGRTRHSMLQTPAERSKNNSAEI